MLKNILLMAMLVLLSAQTQASPVFEVDVEAPFKSVWDQVYASLEEQRFFVIFEPTISESLKRFEERWGEDYNRNEFSDIRSMVFCNPWYANQVGNKDPKMLALCPLHLTVVHRKGTTSVYFVRPSIIAADSPALDTLREIEETVIGAIKSGVEKAISK